MKVVKVTLPRTLKDVDIYIHGHTHLPTVLREGFYRTDMSNGVVKYVDKLFVNGSARLRYGGYGEAFEFKTSSISCPTLYLSGTTKLATASL